jgi:hypothetical protein
MLPLKGEQFAFAPDGKSWAVTDGNDIRICDAASGQERSVLRGHTRSVWAVAWSPDGKRLASGTGLFGREVKLWDVEGAQEYAAVPVEFSYPLRFSPDGRFLCLGLLRLEEDLPEFPVNHPGRYPPPLGLWRPAGALEQWERFSAFLDLWDLSTRPPRHVGTATAEQVVAPDGSVLARIGDRDPTAGPRTIAKRVPLSLRDGNPDAPRFTPDGKMLLLHGECAMVRGRAGDWLACVPGVKIPNLIYQYKWVNVDTWQTQAVLEVEAAGTLSPDMTVLATREGGAPVKLWRVPPRRPLWPPVTLAVLVGLLLAGVAYRRRRRRSTPDAPPLRLPSAVPGGENH